MKFHKKPQGFSCGPTRNVLWSHKEFLVVPQETTRNFLVVSYGIFSRVNKSFHVNGLVFDSFTFKHSIIHPKTFKNKHKNTFKNRQSPGCLEPNMAAHDPLVSKLKRYWFEQTWQTVASGSRWRPLGRRNARRDMFRRRAGISSAPALLARVVRALISAQGVNSARMAAGARGSFKALYTLMQSRRVTRSATACQPSASKIGVTWSQRRAPCNNPCREIEHLLHATQTTSSGPSPDGKAVQDVRKNMCLNKKLMGLRGQMMENFVKTKKDGVTLFDYIGYVAIPG